MRPWAHINASAYMLYIWLVPISGKAVVKRLKQEGWTVKSRSGSHVKLENECSEIVVVPSPRQQRPRQRTRQGD